MKYNITLKQLEAFVTVAKQGSFAEACERLYISQPALSISIKNLEEALGGKLFFRTTRSIELSPEGRAFLAQAERILLDTEAAIDDVRDRFLLSKGTLNIAVMPSFAAANLSRYLAEFKKLHPDINIKISDIVAEDAIDMVRVGRAELAITFDPGEHEDLYFQSLFEDQFIAALPANNPLLQGQTTDWHSLSRFPFIALQKPSSIRYLIEEALTRRGLALNVEIEVNQLLTIVKLVNQGMGVSVLPKLFASEFSESGVKFLPLTDPNISRNIGIVTHKRKAISTAASRFIELISQLK